MIYLLKNIASLLLPPGIFFVLLASLIFILWKQNKKIAKALAVVTLVFYFCSTGLVAESLVRSLESRYIPPSEVSGDVVIMLGGGATVDTPDVTGKGQLSSHASNRLLTTALLQKKLNVPIILAGGQVYADSGAEAVIAKRILIGLGIAENKIFIDDKSLNTKQNAENVGKIINEQNFSKPILVTSAFHMERSVLNFHKAGLAVLPYPADYMANINGGEFYFAKILPSSGALDGTVIVCREWLGIWTARLVK